MIFFEVDFFREGCGRMMNVPVFRNEISIEPEAPAVLTGEANQIVPSFRRHENAGPTHRIVI